MAQTAITKVIHIFTVEHAIGIQKMDQLIDFNIKNSYRQYFTMEDTMLSMVQIRLKRFLLK